MALRSRAPNRRWILVITLLVWLIAAGCSDGQVPVVITPEPDETPDAEPSPVAHTPVADLLPVRMADTQLEIISVTGETFAQDEQVAAALQGMGKTPAAVSLALGLPPLESSLGFQIGALRVDGFDWATALEAFVAELQDIGGGAVDVVRVTIGGRDVIRVGGLDDPTIAPMYYYALGDVLVYAQSSDEASVAEALEHLPATEAEGSPPDHPAAPPVGTTGIPGLGMVVLKHIDYACVNWVEEFTFQMWYVGMHPNAALFPASVVVSTLPVGQRLGVASQSVTLSGITAIGRFEYRAHTAGAREVPAGERDEIAFSVTDTLNAIYGEFSTGLFDVHLCLSGAWEEGPRTLEVVHVGSSVSADIVEGTLRCGETGRAFTAVTQSTGDGDMMLEGDDLLVCNPESCVDEGKLPNSDRVPFEGLASRDGRTITIQWDAQQFDDECEPTHTLRDSFGISLIEARSPRPH